MIIRKKTTYSITTFLSLCAFTVNASTQINLPTVDCVINPSKVVSISAPVAGIIETIHVDQGDSVKKGQLLAQLGSAIEESNIALAQARTKMTADLSTQKTNYKYDSLQVKRVKSLADRKLTSPQNKDEAQRLKQLSFWQIAQAKELLKIRQLELLKARAQLAEKKIYAKHDAVVTQRLKNEGEYVDGHPVLTLAQLNPLHVTAVFPIEYINRINKDHKAQVFTEIDQKTALPAVVDRIDTIGDAASGTFSVRFSLDNSENTVSAGLKCFLQIQDKNSNKGPNLNTTQTVN
jgi:RND family efflux transporter MFP subunit